MKKNLLNGIMKSYKKYQNNLALQIGSDAYSYKQIILESNLWAHNIIEYFKTQKINSIGILSSKDFVGYLGIITSLMLNSSFVPLNPKLPINRLLYIITSSDLDVIILDAKYVEILIELDKILDNNHSKKIKIFSPQSKIKNEFRNFKVIDSHISNVSTFLNDNIKSSSIAYILFTSGSTGNPKGVPISHKNVISFIDFNQSKYKINSSDRLSQTFDHSFDLSMFDIFMAWFHGASVFCLQSLDLLSPEEFINTNKISIWFSVPSIIGLLKRQNYPHKNTFPTLRLSLFCGEALSLNYIKFWQEAAPNSICENLYGPTELTICCSFYNVTSAKNILCQNDIVSIGNIYPHLKYCIWDNSKNCISNDNIGELCVSGDQMFKGYLNKNENKNKFIEIENIKCKVKYYKTGDLIRKDESGNLLYLGRIDRQIKLNGYRIELSDIENSIQNHQNVDYAVVALIEKQDTKNSFLSAHVFGNLHFEELDAYIKKNLPYYMQPKHIKISNEPILSPNGKLDRKFIQEKLIFDGINYE
ncbi:AMP-binding protein [Pigmentibacter sp. JX0631]|uniref:AMP-binding protein n=1 Tax=Pigmentibacter sp. JX0631 TaxID=2976982 RepID=UPI002468B73A|nr:AMP-binding protein [Pigmentibacter sp. JX0631]WGL60470.1 AMP-binding protein [Pigmentibacter sp. JX0631]